jgi:hypothetical protein
MSTFYDQNSKSFSESEITEFVGNAKNFQVFESNAKIKKVTKTEHLGVGHLVKDQPGYLTVQSPARTVESRKINVNRIYSSNASRNSTNLREKINQTHRSPFKCPEKMSNFRSLSPFIKTSQESED